MSTHYRQGDVLITAFPMPHLADKMAPAPLEAGRVVLAHGEATGHAHAISPTCSTRYLRDLKANIEAADPPDNKFPDSLQQFLDVLEEAGISVYEQRATMYGTDPDVDRYLDVQSELGALLDHEEHCPVHLPYGQHIVRIQVEYEPAEGSIRVAD